MPLQKRGGFVVGRWSWFRSALRLGGCYNVIKTRLRARIRICHTEGACAFWGGDVEQFYPRMRGIQSITIENGIRVPRGSSELEAETGGGICGGHELERRLNVPGRHNRCGRCRAKDRIILVKPGVVFADHLDLVHSVGEPG